MKFSYQILPLKLRDPFTISRGTTTLKKNMFLQLGEGIGEAAPSSYYGENYETVTRFLRKAQDYLRKINPFEIEQILEGLNKKFSKDYAAKMAVDSALYDWVGKKVGLPVWKLLGLSKEITAETSFTIGIDTPERMQEKTKRVKGFKNYKVKVGVKNDIEMVEAVREVTKAKIRVDANCGWNAKQAVDKMKQLEKLAVEFVEQPLHPDDKEGYKYLRRKTNLPIFIDEGVKTSEDIYQWKDLATGINIKLAKCGGIREALRMIHTARALRMKIMIGCMIESSLAITAAAQLGSLVDYLDLDGMLLIKEDPFSGIKVKNGKLYLSDLPGLGVKATKYFSAIRIGGSASGGKE